MVSNPAQCAPAIAEQELPVAFAARKEIPHLASHKTRINGDSIHLADRGVVIFMRYRSLDDELTHIKVIVVIREHYTVFDTLVMVGREVKRRAYGYLQCSRQSLEHHVSHRLNCQIKHRLCLPVVADHDGQVWVQPVFRE